MQPAGEFKNRTTLLLAMILILAAGLRWHGITARGFFFDELWNLQLANGHASEMLDLPLNQLVDQPSTLSRQNARPIWQIPAHMTGAIHPPLGFMVLRVWRDVFGDSMLALRCHAATWSLVAVALTFVAARMSFGPRPALWAALLAALSFGNIDQAQDLRAYMLLQSLMLLSVIALLKLRGRTSSWTGAMAVGVGVLAMMFTHYFAAGACVAIVFGAITLLHGRVRRQTLACIAMAGVIWLVAWLPSLRAQMAYVPETADIFLLDPTESPFVSTALRLLASPYRALTADPRPTATVPLIGGAIIIALVLIRLRRRADDASGDRKLVRFWLAIVLCVLGSLLAIDLLRQSRHLEYMKYYVLITPALCVLIGSIRLWRTWLMPGVASVTMAVLLFTTPTPPKPDLRPQLAWLRERASPNDIFILPSYNPLGRDGQTTYLSLAHALSWPRHRIAIPVGKPPATLVESLPKDARWFYLSFDARYSPSNWLPGATVVETGPLTQAGVWEVRPVEPARQSATAP